MRNTPVIIIILLTLNACSNAAWYKGMQTREQNQCLTVPPSEYDNCMKNANDSYGEYQDKQKETDK